MTQADLRLLRAQQTFDRMQYERQLVQQNGVASQDFSDAGPPAWSRPAWDAFFAQYGRYPFSASELPPSMEGCPSWAFELMGLRQPPVQVNNGVG